MSFITEEFCSWVRDRREVGIALSWGCRWGENPDLAQYLTFLPVSDVGSPYRRKPGALWGDLMRHRAWGIQALPQSIEDMKTSWLNKACCDVHGSYERFGWNMSKWKIELAAEGQLVEFLGRESLTSFALWDFKGQVCHLLIKLTRASKISKYKKFCLHVWVLIIAILRGCWSKEMQW